MLKVFNSITRGHVYLLFLFLILLLPTSCVTKKNPKLGQLAPDFQLKDKNGNAISLQSYRGKVVVLNFWATWCQPCRHEMPSLEALYKKYQTQNFVVLGVSLDEEGWSQINQFSSKFKISFPILLDSEMKVSELYQTYMIPETFLIDSSGKIVDQFTGPQSFNSPVFFEKIEALLSPTQSRDS